MSEKAEFYSRIMLAVLVGVLIGLLVAPETDKEILYVSQDEVLAIEKERLEKLGGDDRGSLFMGEVKKSFHVIQDIVSEMEDAGHIVVYSKGRVAGRAVIPASRRVHEELINRIAQLSVRDK